MDFQKQWTRWVGAFFLLVSVIYMIQYASEHQLLSIRFTIAIGMLVGGGLAAWGYSSMLRDEGPRWFPTWFWELITGLGITLVYGMLALAGVRDAFWSPFVIFVLTALLSLGVAATAYKYEHRVLLNLSAAGALLSPLLMEPQGDQVWTLFLYLLALNTAVWFVSLMRGWMESRILMFIGTWVMYGVYYVYYDPLVEQVDSLPLRYATASFIYFAVAFGIAMWRDWSRWNGLHLYLAIINATIFAMWTQVIIPEANTNSMYAIWIGMGMLYLLSALVLVNRTGTHAFPVLANFTGGVLLILFAVDGWFSGSTYESVISTFVWLCFAVLLGMIGRIRQMVTFDLAASIVWFLTTLYWFGTTWDVPRMDYFGVYVPFLNIPALAWIGLAAYGIYLSRQVRERGHQLDPEIQSILSVATAAVSMLIIGGLLKFQLENLWAEWALEAAVQALSQSVVWAVYAVILMIWGVRSRTKLYHILGTVFLVIVALKAIFFDLQEEDSLFKIFTFLALGIIFLAVNAIKPTNEDPDRVEGEIVTEITKEQK